MFIDFKFPLNLNVYKLKPFSQVYVKVLQLSWNRATTKFANRQRFQSKHVFRESFSPWRKFLHFSGFPRNNFPCVHSRGTNFSNPGKSKSQAPNLEVNKGRLRGTSYRVIPICLNMQKITTLDTASLFPPPTTARAKEPDQAPPIFQSDGVFFLQSLPFSWWGIIIRFSFFFFFFVTL